MDDRESVKYIIIVYFALIFISRLVNYLLGTYYVDSQVKCEIITFAIIYIMDTAAMYAMLKFGHGRGIGLTIYLAMLKVFPFILFYVLGVLMIYIIINQITNIINFIMM